MAAFQSGQWSNASVKEGTVTTSKDEQTNYVLHIEVLFSYANKLVSIYMISIRVKHVVQCK